MSEDINWINTRMAVKISAMVPVVDANGKVTFKPVDKQILMPNKFNINHRQNFDKIHGFSSGEFNAGTVRKINDISWSVDIPVNSSTTRLFRALFEDKISCTSGVDGVGNDFKLVKEEYYGCRVNNVDLNIVTDDIPTVNVEGVALTWNYQNTASTDVVTSTTNVDGYLGGNYAEKNNTVTGAILDVW